MIEAHCITETSIIRSVVVKGHSSGSRDNRIVCAAVSVLIRTLCEIVSRYPGVNAVCDAPGPGDVMLVIHNVDSGIKGEMLGVSNFFLFGIISVVRDYPDSIKLKINNKDWYNGSQERWW